MDHQHITRRQALVGAACAAVTVGAAVAASASPASQMHVLVEAHRSAKAAMDVVQADYDALSEQNPTPQIRVVTGVDHYTKEPCHWAYSTGDIRLQAEQRKFRWMGGSAHDGIDAWADRKIEELNVLAAERRRIRENCGLDAMFDQLDTAEGIEYEAWMALVSAKPADLPEAAQRAAYFLTLHEDANDGNHRLVCWLEEYLRSFQ